MPDMATNAETRPLPNVNLKLLNTFMLVAEHQSFRQAADDSHRSQSAVTAQIKQLEAQLGVTLFHRTTRQVRLTLEGEQLLESARRAVHEVERGLRRIQETADLKRGRIFLSCSSTVASTRLAPILASFQQDYPGVEVFVQELNSNDMFETVRKEVVDFGIGPRVNSSEFDFESILEEPLFALVPKNLMPQASDRITLSDLSKLPLLLLNPATALRALLEDTAKALGLTLQTRFQFSQAQTLISMANAGLGVAILPSIVVPQRPHADTHSLLIVDPPLIRQVALVTIKGRALTPAAKRLSELVRELIGPPGGPKKRRTNVRPNAELVDI